MLPNHQHRRVKASRPDPAKESAPARAGTEAGKAKAAIGGTSSGR